MSHRDRMPEIVVNYRVVKQVVDWLLPPKLFRSLPVRAGARWSTRLIAVTALVCGMLSEDVLEERFQQARRLICQAFPRRRPGTSRQGFLKVLARWHDDLKPLVVERLQNRMKTTLANTWEIEGHVAFAGDGSRAELARTRSLIGCYAPRKAGKSKQRSSAARKRAAKKRALKKQQRQSAASVAKKANSPQVWLTLLWHVGSRLPWTWRSGPSDSSEREHLRQMWDELPPNALITADAGFVGYEFWNALLASGRHFLIRVGGNVKLLRRLGHARQADHVVYLWPDNAAKRGESPLALRLIVLHNGKQAVYLVTNLAKNELSDRAAASVYQMRWGIELFFRTFKQTFGHGKLRSRAAANVPLELDWSLLGLWAMCLVGQRELIASGRSPQRQSHVKVIRAFQSAIRDYLLRPPSAYDTLLFQLRTAALDAYERRSSKTSHDYPRKKQRERPGEPKITVATPQQIARAKRLKQQQTDFQLAA